MIGRRLRPLPRRAAQRGKPEQPALCALTLLLDLERLFAGLSGQPGETGLDRLLTPEGLLGLGGRSDLGFCL
ncbi:MAG: hypothetical protein KGL54_03390 [Sphingomonadales bacterium]|nr:hypothetical protein [Sphingomonadales bacterium]